MKKTIAGITGGIGSGKSVISRMLKAMGYPVFAADEESKKILDHDPEVRRQVIALLGSAAYAAEGSADRQFIAGIVFTDPSKLEALNQILHPVVRRHFLAWAEAQKGNLVFKEAAILFESGSYSDMDLVIGVTAPDAVRIQRVMDRDGKTEDEVRTIMNRQMPTEELISRCDFVIENDGQQLVIPQLLHILDKIRERQTAA
jgi:dephospho-CoA kinase